MNFDWEEKPLSELVTIKHGFAFKGEDFSEKPTAYVLTTPGNFAIGGGFRVGKKKFYSGAVPVNYKLKPGDLLVTMTDLSKQADTLGSPAWVPVGLPENYLHNQRVGLVELKPNSIASKRWIYYLMRTSAYRGWIVNSASGSTVKHTSPTRIGEFIACVPPPSVQKETIRILDPIEATIALLTAENTALEAMAQTLFRSWFVDFDPIHAKAAGKEPEAMSAELAKLFPSEFEDSELGAIPKGWSVTPFSRAVAIHSGGTPKTSVPEYWGGDIPWFSVTDAPSDGQVFVLTTAKKITKEGLAHSPTKLLPRRATIISARGTVGKIGMVEGYMTMNQSCYALAPIQGAGEYWVYFQTRGLVSQLKQMAHGGVFDTITKSTFDGVKVVVPSNAIQHRFSQVCQPIFDFIANNGRLVATLTQLRDHLLPRLISGKLRIEDAEASFATITSALETEPA